jgi:peptidoglycan hydrolase CwlO-like protein
MSKNVKKAGIQARLDDLKKQVDWFYGDDFDLDIAVKKYKKILAEGRALETELANLKNEIVELGEDFSKEQ